MVDVLNWFADHWCCGSGLLLVVFLIVCAIGKSTEVVVRGYDPNPEDDA